MANLNHTPLCEIEDSPQELIYALYIYILFNYTFGLVNFKSLKRYVIFTFYQLGIIDLQETPSSSLSNYQLAKSLKNFFPIKIKKIRLRKFYFDMDKETFNKYFRQFLDENNLLNKRKFNLTQFLAIINAWQGDGIALNPKGYRKQELAQKITNRNYDKLEELFDEIEGNIALYKTLDIISPKRLKKFLISIDKYNYEFISQFEGIQ